MIQFGTDGWRGLIDKDFTEKNVALAVQAIANYFLEKGKKSVVIGFDVRRKAEKFAKIASEIMAGNGIKVYLSDIATPTPTIGWAIIAKKAHGAIMFTASHNPEEFLGLKYMTEEAMVAPAEVTDKFTENLKVIKPKNVKSHGYYYAIETGYLKIFDPRKEYLRKLKELVELDKIRQSSLKVLINPMHGVGCGYLKQLLGGGKLKAVEMNGDPDPTFGGLPPEPIVEKNVLDAIERVKKEKFDICISSDGDSDRIGLIDEKGRMITSLEAFLLLAYYVIVVRQQQGAVVRTLSNTIMVDHLGQKLGFPVFETKVGFKYVGEKMKETGAVFGGEESGGSAIMDFMLVRDAQIMGLFILDLMITMKMPLSELLTYVETKAGGAYFFKREDFHFPYEKYEEIKNKKSKDLVENPPVSILNKKIVRTRIDDGVKFFFEDDSWLLIRFSGTEPVLRTYAEARSIDEVKSLLQFAQDYFK